MKVCGSNKYYQIGENSKNKESEEGPCIFPPINLELESSKLLSFSAYGTHTVWITEDFIGHCIGDNKEGKIAGNIPFEIYEKEKNFFLEDGQGLPISILSAVCGQFYTLYLVSRQDGNHLALVHRSHNDGTQIILNLKGSQPIALFGGYQSAAAIDENGEIYIVTESSLDDPLKKIKPHFLPDHEKATCVACGLKKIIALGNRGRVFQADLSVDGNLDHFQEIPELCSMRFVHVSGTFEHFFAVTEDGRVFAQGENQFCQLGLGKSIDKSEKFIEVKDLNEQNIICAYAGESHSLFQTKDGKILSCGKNNFGQLLLESGQSNELVYEPVETLIKEKATFCIAGNGLSVVFVGVNPPPKTPNMIISYT